MLRDFIGNLAPQRLLKQKLQSLRDIVTSKVFQSYGEGTAGSRWHCPREGRGSLGTVSGAARLEEFIMQIPGSAPGLLGVSAGMWVMEKRANGVNSALRGRSDRGYAGGQTRDLNNLNKLEKRF